MKTAQSNTVALVVLMAVIYGCDTGSKPVTKIPPVNKPGSTGTKPKFPPGETPNSTTKKFRHSTIKMDTDLNFLRLQGEWVFSTPFNRYDGLAMGRLILLIRKNLAAG